ncbi:MAG: GTPase HflX, partial [Coriobacteriia bacterium]|nr:GTPase HflX [Coriobacteriia bacterium]
LLLHVIDTSHPMAKAQMAAVSEVLGELGAAKTPQMLVYNKIDLVEEGERAQLERLAPGAVFVSGARRLGLEDLLDRISVEAAQGDQTLDVLIPYTRGDLVRLAHEEAYIVSEEHTETGTHLIVRVPVAHASSFSEFTQKHEAD